MRRYKILLVVRHPVGGIRTFLRYVYRQFDSARYSFTLISPDIPEVRVLLEDLNALDLIYAPTERDVSDRTLVQVVTKALRTGKFDLIHSHGFTSAACSIVGAGLTQTPHILTCHDVFTDGQFVGVRGGLKKIALALMLATANGIQCVSYDARDNLLRYLKMRRLFQHKVIVIPNGIDVERFQNPEQRDLRQELGLPENTFLIGYFGRFMSQKGFRYLANALEQIMKNNQDLPKQPVVLSFSQADGFIREEMENVKRRGLAGSVYFLPFVADVASTLKGLDVVVMPSLWEAGPLLAMEAMVAGVPVIGTSCVGLREVLQNTPAKVVPPKNTLALTEALLMEMQSPTTAKAREFAMEAVARFQVGERAQEIEKLMLKFLEG
ncbi:MAG: glycosyltransferase family 4 protein [Gammaproteobacteria bacterium]|nr:glycosyltransferase family 4 protein [Gammaproteobacteria bacterium]